MTKSSDFTNDVCIATVENGRCPVSPAQWNLLGRCSGTVSGFCDWELGPGCCLQHTKGCFCSR